jgi:hypothetical protein
MKNTIIKTITPAAALLFTACSEAERSAPEAVATLYTLQSGCTSHRASCAYPVAYYHINKDAGYIYARTTDGKRIYSSSFTLILNK